MFRRGTIRGKSIIRFILIIPFMILAVNINAQSEKKFIRQGNRQYEKNKYSDSEILYRKAIDKNKYFPDAVFNAGDALYKQNKYEDAGKQFIENSRMNEDKTKKSAGLYNLGNSLLKANKLKESIDAYEGSLKLKPDNREAKYNLAYAQDLLKKQQEQQKNKDNQDKNKKDQNKDNKKQDQKDNKKDQKDNNKEQPKDQNNQYNKQQQEQQKGISKEDAQRVLNALANDEKKVQEKVKLEEVSKSKVRTVRNW